MFQRWLKVFNAWAKSYESRPLGLWYYALCLLLNPSMDVSTIPFPVSCSSSPHPFSMLLYSILNLNSLSYVLKYLLISYHVNYHVLSFSFVIRNFFSPPARPMSPSSKSTRRSNAKPVRKVVQRFALTACDVQRLSETFLTGHIRDIRHHHAVWFHLF